MGGKKCMRCGCSLQWMAWWSVCSTEPHMQRGTEKGSGPGKERPNFFSACLPSLPRLFSRHWAADGPGLVFGVCFHSCHWLLIISRVAVVQSGAPEFNHLGKVSLPPCYRSWVPRPVTHRIHSVRLWCLVGEAHSSLRMAK